MPLPPLERILLVDDEADIRQIVRLALESLGGFKIHECSSGLSAPRAIEEFSPQLILMDVMMPGQDGPETLKALRENLALPRIPVVFMTAKVQPQEVSALRGLGALDVIAKPFDPMTLAQTVKRIWAAQRQG
ncbi:MAG: response regulator [Gammaproteobacteria bacterium]